MGPARFELAIFAKLIDSFKTEIAGASKIALEASIKGDSRDAIALLRELAEWGEN